MCGIAGFYSQNSNTIRSQEIQILRETLIHRGPDDVGYLFYNRIDNCFVTNPSETDFQSSIHVGLAHNRLSIIDLSTDGHQPLPNEDNTLWVIHNGEIYNYIELRAELEKKGHSFFSLTDTEVIVHSYEEWGSECLNKFNGMWAFVIFDLRNDSLFCARDRFGIKPFYYILSDKKFYFASEIKTLLKIPDLSIEIHNEKVLRYLVWGLIDDDEQTLLKSVRRLRPGYFLLINQHQFKELQYYNLKSKISPTKMNEDRNVEIFRELFFDSVRLRLRSDVPLGTCLSGGLDSSSILSTIRDISPQGQIIYTFSSVFEGESSDESPYIKIMVDYVKAKSYYTNPDATELIHDMDQLIRCQDEPFWSTSIYSHWCVMKLAKEAGVAVLLDGQGGDELLSGYHYYFIEYLLHLLQNKQITKFYRELQALNKFYAYPKLKLLAETLALSLPAELRYRLQKSSNYVEKAAINQDLISGDNFYKHYNSINSDRLLNRGYYDFFYSLPLLLRNEDRNSMAFSLESRVPFLDYRLVEFLFQVPAEQKIKNGVTKYLMRKSFASLLPEKILNRRDKVGFFTPEHKWIRNTLVNPMLDIFHSQRMKNRGIFNIPILLKYFQQFQNGKTEISYIIWRWFNFEKWLEQIEDYPVRNTK